MILSLSRKKAVVNAAAQHLLASDDIALFPFSIQEHIQSLKIILRTYTQVQSKAFDTHELFDISKDAKLINFSTPQRNGYMLIYNNCVGSNDRIRFSIAHELAHFVLKHEFANFQNIQSVNSIQEAEADLFAANFLAPAPIVKLLKSPQNKRNMFGLSAKAWQIRLQTLEADLALLDIHLAQNIVQKFYAFMYKKRCKLCDTIFISPESQCPHCNSPKIDWIGRDLSAQIGTPFYP